MSNLVTKKESIPDLRPEERALLLNDLSKLTPDQRSDLYAKVCSSIGINPLTQPFQYLQLGGKLVFYATRNCTDQLRSLNQVSVTIQSREKVDDLYVVNARATLPGGRTDESIAAVQLTGLKGDALANAIMKCETKAKRRVTLSICGLSFMDESEVETVRGAVPIDVTEAHALPPSPQPENEKQVSPPIENQQHPPDDLDIALGNTPKHPPGSPESMAGFLITFGPHKGKTLGQVNERDLRDYCNTIVDTATAKKIEIDYNGPAGKLLDAAAVFLGIQ